VSDSSTPTVAKKVQTVQKSVLKALNEGSNMDADIDDGHIVAASLGGSNTERLNFFPQTGTSNRLLTGAYQLAEKLAQTKLKALDPADAHQCVKITIDFAVPHVTQAHTLANSIPAGGSYTVDYDDGCGTTTAVWKRTVFNFQNAVPNHTQAKYITETITQADVLSRAYTLT